MKTIDILTIIEFVKELNEGLSKEVKEGQLFHSFSASIDGENVIIEYAGIIIWSSGTYEYNNITELRKILLKLMKEELFQFRIATKVVTKSVYGQ